MKVYIIYSTHLIRKEHVHINQNKFKVNNERTIPYKTSLHLTTLLRELPALGTLEVKNSIAEFINTKSHKK